ncbi:unnamed protein product [Cuscuta epithymum]|uniref:RING-type domain-containing protein n=1 Tax=Cuscuta epithymum TaxID=186058 RepID=A0AAV0G314_9ASTE|nr:unnamed protein product [Cuscuta epithymum]
MDQVANGLQSDEFYGEIESPDQQCCQSNTVLKRQSQTQYNKPPLPGKTCELHMNNSREKIDPTIKVSTRATKRNGKISIPKEEGMVKAQSSQPTKDSLTESQRSRAKKTLDLQQGQVNTNSVIPTKASTKCKKGNAMAGTSTSLQSSMEKGKTHMSGSQSRTSTRSKKSFSPKKSLSNKDHIYHIKYDGFSKELKKVGVTCVLCEEDLSCISSDYEYQYYEDQEESGPMSYPEVAVLQCGHSFHFRCFAYSIPDELCFDPPCVLCASYET